MTFPDIISYRLINQQLTDSEFKSPDQVVHWMGAVQAQDYAMSKWAVGIRIPGSTDEQVERAIDKGEIIRTHVLRPTWHLVQAADIRWMLELTAPHVNQKAGTQYRQLELDDKLFKKTNSIIEKALRNNNQLTREEIMKVLAKKGILTNNLRGAHLMFRAELDRIVCNGARRGKQFTYALLDERVPETKSLKKDEALAKLANRYFTSHGPATIQDFSWWSGLPVTFARQGLEAVKNELLSEKANGNEYWFANNIKINKQDPDIIHLLPAYDEWMISYTDRTASLDPAYLDHVISINGIFKPVITIRGMVVGLWKRTIKNKKVIIEPEIFHSRKKIKKRKLDAVINDYAKFIGLEAELG